MQKKGDANLSLKSVRKEKKMKQVEVAAVLGIKQQRLSHYECGIRQPKPFMLRKLASLYGCTIDDLIGDGDDETRIRKQDKQTA